MDYEFLFFLLVVMPVFYICDAFSYCSNEDNFDSNNKG